jgi:hypothetical protein
VFILPFILFILPDAVLIVFIAPSWEGGGREEEDATAGETYEAVL